MALFAPVKAPDALYRSIDLLPVSEPNATSVQHQNRRMNQASAKSKKNWQSAFWQ